MVFEHFDSYVPLLIGELTPNFQVIQQSTEFLPVITANEGLEGVASGSSILERDT